MKQLAIAILLGVVLPCNSAWAQEAPRVEVNGGYALLHETGLNINGFSAGLEATVAKYLGIVGDFGMGFKTMTESGVTVDAKTYTYVVGPRFNYRSKTVRAFGEVLFGGVHLSAGTSFEGVSASVGVTGFAVAYGGGLDVNVSKTIAVRLAQVDVIYSRFTIEGETVTGNDLRYAAGIVVQFGKKK